MTSSTSGAAPRILIVRVGAMGDVLHALPAAALLRANLPAALLRWAVEPRWASLLQAGPEAAAGSAAMPLVDGIHAVPTRQWSKRPLSWATLRSILALRSELRACRYDVAIDLQGSLRSAVIARMSGARIVVGPAAPREAPARWFYSRHVAATTLHVIDQGLEIARAALHLLSQVEPPPDTQPCRGSLLPQEEEAERWAENFCDSVAAPVLPANDSPLVLLAPTAGWGAKQWPADRFAALAAALADRGYSVVLNATPPLPDGVAAQVLQVAGALLPEAGRSRLFVVAATIPQLVALLRRTSLVVAGDTGPLHLGAALGVPVVGLFGPTDPARNGPYPMDRNPAKSIVLRDPGSTTDHRRHASTEPGLARIPVDTVLRAATSLLPPLR